MKFIIEKYLKLLTKRVLNRAKKKSYRMFVFNRTDYQIYTFGSELISLCIICFTLRKNKKRMFFSYYLCVSKIFSISILASIH